MPFETKNKRMLCWNKHKISFKKMNWLMKRLGSCKRVCRARPGLACAHGAGASVGDGGLESAAVLGKGEEFFQLELPQGPAIAPGHGLRVPGWGIPGESCRDELPPRPGRGATQGCGCTGRCVRLITLRVRVLGRHLQKARGEKANVQPELRFKLNNST